MNGQATRILYIGDSNIASTSFHRAMALRRVGAHVDIIDPYKALWSYISGPLGAVNYRSGYVLTRRRVLKWLRSHLSMDAQYDVCWIDSGELLGARAVRLLRDHVNKIVLFNHDDPSGTRDRARFLTLRQAIPEYDLCVVVRPFNVDEFKKLGARDVMHVWRRYDEVAHRVPIGGEDIPAIYINDIAFIGYCINGEGRDHFLLDLVHQGLKPAIWGDNWQNSPVWAKLEPYWRGGSLSGIDYVNAIRGAKICLGLLSKGNRDEHTTRTLEIPYAGGLLCAERTSEHLMLFEDGKEAVFWSSSNECAELCKALIDNAVLRDKIKKAGHLKVVDAGLGNENLCMSILSRLNEVDRTRVVVGNDLR